MRPNIFKLETAGIALATADIAIQAPTNSHYVPIDMRVAEAGEFESVQQLTAGSEWKPAAWPWVSVGKQPVLAYKRVTAKEIHERQVNLCPSEGKSLAEFVQLADVSDEALAASVLSFARRWGPLELCEHGKPFRHFPKDCLFALSAGHNSPWWNEPLEAWRRYARHLRGLLLVASNLLVESPGAQADWQAVVDAEPIGQKIYSPIGELDGEIWGPEKLDVRSRRRDPTSEHNYIAVAVNRWFEYGGVNLIPSWRSEGSFRIETTYSGLTGRLAVDLAAALSSPTGIYRCAGCGIPFTSENRRRARNREKWCDRPDCKLERDRRNSKKYYENKKKRGN